MTYVTPVLKDRVPYDWDALKASTIGREVPHAVEHTAPDMSFFKPEQMQPGVVQPNLQESHESAEPQVQAAVSETNSAATVSASDKNALVNEIVEAVVPLIMQRLHGQVSMMVDLTMKQAAKKIRNDFDDALKGTVRKAVEQVVKEKIG